MEVVLILGVNVVLQHSKLLEEVMLLDTHRAFEEAGQVPQDTDLAAALGEQGKPSQVQDQRRGQERVAPLPGELERHLDSHETGEMDVIPGRLPVVERFNVLDGNVSLRFVT